MSCPSWQWHRTGSRWFPVRILPVAPLWCDQGFVPNRRGNKAAANLRPKTSVTIHQIANRFRVVPGRLAGKFGPVSSRRPEEPTPAARAGPFRLHYPPHKPCPRPRGRFEVPPSPLKPPPFLRLQDSGLPLAPLTPPDLRLQDLGLAGDAGGPATAAWGPGRTAQAGPSLPGPALDSESPCTRRIACRVACIGPARGQLTGRPGMGQADDGGRCTRARPTCGGSVKGAVLRGRRPGGRKRYGWLRQRVLIYRTGNPPPPLPRLKERRRLRPAARLPGRRQERVLGGTAAAPDLGGGGLRAYDAAAGGPSSRGRRPGGGGARR